MVHLRVNVFDLHGCLIDQDADRQREAAQGHQVDGLAAQPQADNPGGDGQRDVQDNDDRAPPVAQKDEYHQTGQDRSQGSFGRQTVDRASDVRRLIELERDIDVGRNLGAELGHRSFDFVDDAHR
ncbi:MAG: hypothetical protein FD138_2367 [Planctomycetota bacterium]|nr:MAG: hypothetical protein FD138_2367 [Planctomycetota bacterium]